MSRQILFAIFFFHTSACISQQKILLIGTHHTTQHDRLKEIIPIAKAVKSFHPGIICVEYPISTDTASVIHKSVILTNDAQIFQKNEALRKEWRIPAGDMRIKIDSLLKSPDLSSDVQKRMELQQFYFLSSDAGNADYQGYLIMAALGKNAQKTVLLRENSPGFGTMKEIYEIKRYRNDEYHRLVFPLAAKLKIAYLYPIDDLSTWKEYEKYYARLQVLDTTNASKIKFRQYSDDLRLEFQSLPKGSNQWIFSNSRQIMHTLLYAEAYKIDTDVADEDIKLLHYYWVQRNRTMAQHIDAVARQYPHTNIVVFFGFSHVGPVYEELNKLSKTYRILTLSDVIK